MARIALDASGGDFAPQAPVAGALLALEELPETAHVVLVGPEAEVRAELTRQAGPAPERLTVVDAPEAIGMAEKPLAAIRSKRRSSIVVGLGLHKAGDVDAFLSAGNTGAVMAASHLLLGIHEGVQRPAIGTVLPTVDNPVLLLDAGANVDCDARELLGFAHLGVVYARDVLRIENSLVGLLNIGEEEEKGNATVKEAFSLMQRSSLRFAGNVEGSDILTDKADVVVCDGFVGNIVLKFYESAGRVFSDLLKHELDDEVMNGPGMGRVFRFLDYSSYGGAPLLGVRGISIICHGRSSPAAIKNALRVAFQSVESNLSQHIHDEFVEGEAVA